MNASLPQVKSLHIYPIKSAAGIEISHSWLDKYGLSFDRRFVLSDNNGQFITARTVPKISLIQVHLTPQGLVLTAPNAPALHINYHDFSEHHQNVVVWGDTIQAQHCQHSYDLWFSQYLAVPCQLLYFGERASRQVKHSTNSVAFADGYPLLLTSQASLDDVNQRSNETLSMARFRPNIVIEHCQAFAEDSWQKIRIGEVEFELAKACSRCTFTTLSPLTAEKHASNEPLATLKSYRQVEGGDIMFGQNLVPLNQGKIQQNDPVEILSKKASLVFIGAEPSSTKQAPTSQQNMPTPSENKKPNITFSSWNKTISGNNHASILEQAESAGLIFPYSCREGMCGACKVYLDSGEVEQNKLDGLSELEQQAGFILTCKSVPKSDICISKIDRTKLRAIKEQEQQLQQQRLAKMQQQNTGNKA